FFTASFAAADPLRDKGAALWEAGKGREQFPDLTNVATLSANEVRERFGDDGVALQAYLRAAPRALAAARPAPLEYAATSLAASLEAYRQGERAQASQLAIQAYLEGYELAESSLRYVDAALMTRIEQDMMAYRAALQSGAPLAQA